MDYKKRKICTIEELVYSDGTIRYNIEGSDEEGTWSEGLYNEVELLVHILVKIGKISLPVVFTSSK